MNKSLLSQDEGKRIVRWSMILFSISAMVCLVWELFGTLFVRSIYNGTSIAILNNLIKYQSTKPVEHYVSLANRLFYNAWLLLGLMLPALVMIDKVLSLRQNREIENRPCELEKSDIAKSSLWRRTDIVTIAIISLAIRAAFLPFLKDLPTCGDATYFWAVPKFLANGQFSSTVMRPPLWGYMLAIPTLIYDHIMSGRILAVLVGSCAPVLLYLLTVKIFNRRTAVIAGLLYAFFPTHIGYSHCLWAEPLFANLMIGSLLFFFLYRENNEKKKYFMLCFIIAGLALLTKEFAVIFFAGLLMTLIFCRINNKVQKVILACILFLIPAIVYSVAASCMTNRVIVLNDSIILNFHRASGLDPGYEYKFETREETVKELMSYLAKRDLVRTLEKAAKQFRNLWAPRSYISTRLAGVFKPESWSYGVANPAPWIATITGYYIFIVLTGIAGLCLARPGHFEIFSIATLLSLTMTGLLAYLVSRYRFSFMFILIIFSAHLFDSGIDVLTRKKRILPIRRTLPIAVMVLIFKLFIDIVASEMSNLHKWG